MADKTSLAIALLAGGLVLLPSVAAAGGLGNALGQILGNAIGKSLAVHPLSATGSKAGVTAPDPHDQALGLVEVTLGVPDANTRGPLGPLRVLSGLALDLFPLRQESFDVRRPDGEWRYFRSTFRVRNAAACPTPGSCPPGAEDLYKVLLVPAATPDTLELTPFSRLTRADGTPVDPHEAERLQIVFGAASGTGAIDPLEAQASEVRLNPVHAPILEAVLGPAYLSDRAFQVQVRAGAGCSRPEHLLLRPARIDLAHDDGLVTVAYRLPLAPETRAAPTTVVVVLALVANPDPGWLADGSVDDVPGWTGQRVPSRCLTLALVVATPLASASARP